MNIKIPDKGILCVFYTLAKVYLGYTSLTTKNTFIVPLIFYSVETLDLYSHYLLVSITLHIWEGVALSKPFPVVSRTIYEASFR